MRVFYATNVTNGEQLYAMTLDELGILLGVQEKIAADAVIWHRNHRLELNGYIISKTKTDFTPEAQERYAKQTAVRPRSKGKREVIIRNTAPKSELKNDINIENLDKGYIGPYR